MGGTLNLHQRKGEGQGAKLSPKPSVNKHRKGSEGREQVSSLPEVGKVVDHRAHLLSQRAASKTKLPHKTEKQTVNCNRIDS
jgi:hypothetical protein